MLNIFNTGNIYRKYLLNRVADGPLKDYLSTPLPEKNNNLYNTEFISLDFETTGLDANKDHILSIGYTLIRNGRIVLAENGYLAVTCDNELQQHNVVIHQITDDQAKQGMRLSQAIELLLKKLTGRIVITHHASIEKSFLIAACKKLYGYALPLQVIDTLKLSKKKMERQHQPIKPNSLRLFNLRNTYGLPRYNAHNALEDAIATAELFLAIASYREPELKQCKIKDFL